VLSAIELEKLYNDALEPYAKELGLLLHAWNDLHINVTLLFLAICQRERDDEEERDILLALWNAVPNERMQRHMLRQSARIRFGRIEKRMQEMGIIVDLIKENEALQLDEILWILNSADTLGRKRDDSAHVPLTLHAKFRPPCWQCCATSFHAPEKPESTTTRVRNTVLLFSRASVMRKFGSA